MYRCEAGSPILSEAQVGVVHNTRFHEEHKLLEAFLSGTSDISYFCVLANFILYLDAYSREEDRISLPAMIGSIISVIYGIFWFITDYVGGIYIQDADSITHGSLYILGQVGGYVTGILSVVILIRRWKDFNRRERLGFVMFIFVPLIGSLFKSILKDITAMPLLVTISIVFIHSFIQTNREMLLKQQQADLARMQADLVTNRLKPHFIYNALNTIYQTSRPTL